MINNFTLYNSDCRSMVELPDESVQCVVTSPPYWGLRKYDGNQEIKEWGCAFGLEPTPELYVQHTVEILREIRRVLRKDGVVFWNIGDSYCGSNCGYGDYRGNKSGIPIPKIYGSVKKPQAKVGKPKDMCLIPQRVAIALQSDGWWIRSDIIWHKPNPMPESVRDRPTNSYEHILMLTKSKKYYWDASAVREPHTESTLKRIEYGLHQKHPSDIGVGIPPVNTDKMGSRFAGSAGRNIRDVWTFPTQPFPGSHFAVFPEKLPMTCIKAATSEKGCCPKCGAPWSRIITKHIEGELQDRPYCGGGQLRSNGTEGGQGTQHSSLGQQDKITRETTGWKPTCSCGLEPIPCTVLDCFAGAGTTLLVAKKLGRKAVGYEISSAYCKMIEARVNRVLL